MMKEIVMTMRMTETTMMTAVLVEWGAVGWGVGAVPVGVMRIAVRVRSLEGLRNLEGVSI